MINLGETESVEVIHAVKFNTHGELARKITQHRAHSPTATERESVGE